MLRFIVCALNDKILALLPSDLQFNFTAILLVGLFSTLAVMGSVFGVMIYFLGFGPGFILGIFVVGILFGGGSSKMSDLHEDELRFPS